MLASLLAPRGAAAASATVAGAARPWRSVSAPPATTTLAFLDYVMQPPPEEPEQPDTARPRIEPPLPPAGQQPPPQPINQPAFGATDTARHGTVNQSFPGGAPAALETLGPPMGNRPITPPSVSSSAPPAPHVRGGILGLNPLILLAGLIAVHIFVVTKVVK